VIEHVYLVCYDIRDPKRWRRVFRLMKGYGEWVQLSVFQCRHGPQRNAEMQLLLDGAIKDDEDHLLIIDIGPADRVEPKFTSLGKGFDLLERGPIVI
jgi:CRISPR-associated protein Cas2